MGAICAVDGERLHADAREQVVINVVDLGASARHGEAGALVAKLAHVVEAGDASSEEHIELAVAGHAVEADLVELDEELLASAPPLAACMFVVVRAARGHHSLGVGLIAGSGLLISLRERSAKQAGPD